MIADIIVCVPVSFNYYSALMQVDNKALKGCMTDLDQQFRNVVIRKNQPLKNYGLAKRILATGPKDATHNQTSLLAASP
ncbi:MAG: hypothetical protein ABGX37_09360 [Methylococcales bacterium]